MKIETFKSGNTLVIHCDYHYMINATVTYEKRRKKGLYQYPVDWYIYHPFDMSKCLPNDIQKPICYGTLYISATHHYTVNEIIYLIIKDNALFSSFLAKN